MMGTSSVWPEPTIFVNVKVRLGKRVIVVPAMRCRIAIPLASVKYVEILVLKIQVRMRTQPWAGIQSMVEGNR
jgi:hypothetical protein